jgi:probable rRNA maturation factor
MVMVDVEYAVEHAALPGKSDFHAWAAAIASTGDKPQEVSLRIVGEQEMRELNSRYRNKACATNVLSFPAGLHAEVDIPFIGDVIICAPVVEKEAAEQEKSVISHWAHMTVHGILHLQGFDHNDNAEAAEMEQTEITILDKLGYSNPYI